MSQDVLPARAAAPAAEGVNRVLVVAVSAVLVAGVVAFGWLIVSAFNRSLAPELARRASLIGETVTADTERALELGIPMESLVGVDEYFTLFLDEFEELDYLAIRDPSGTVVFAPGDVPPGAAGINPPGDSVIEVGDSVVYGFPIELDGATAGSVDVGVDRFFVRSRLQDLALDVGLILIVAMVAAFEVLLALSHRIVGRPSLPAAVEGAVAQAGSVADARLVLFLFVVGEELNKSFLPLFIQSADNPTGLDPAIAISLPIVAYLLTIAIASPFAGRLVAAFGHRGLFLVGLVASAASHLGMVFAGNVLQIIGLRGLTGIGYALATIACLEYMLERMERGSRARTIGVFVAVVIGGTFAGTALGGVLADRLGYQAVFVISFFVVVGAGVLALGMMQPGRGHAEVPPAVSVRDLIDVLKRPSMLLLLAGVTIPMNVVMAAFLWYLVPLSLAAIGSGAATIARVLMVYYLIILLAGPLAAKLADQHINPRILVGVGSLLSGVILLLAATSPSVWTIAVAVLVVGVGHTAVRGPQVALALDLADREFPEAGRGPVLAAMRSLERLGSLAGLLVVAVLAAMFGLDAATAAIGVAAAIAAVVYLLASSRVREGVPVA